MTNNEKAFLWMIRTGEGTTGPDGYRTLVGGRTFDSYDYHPRRVITIRFRNGKKISSSAAGAYQFLTKTWEECRDALDLPDFSPASQDRAALFLIGRRKARGDVNAGRIYTAIRKCNKEWASLPGSPYGQPVMTWDEALEVYEKAGGVNIETG